MQIQSHSALSFSARTFRGHEKPKTLARPSKKIIHSVFPDGIPRSFWREILGSNGKVTQHLGSRFNKSKPSTEHRAELLPSFQEVVFA